MQDEVDPRCWQNNPKIAAWLQQNGMNVTQLYGYFELKISDILHKAGKQMMAWDDVFEKAPWRRCSQAMWCMRGVRQQSPRRL